MTSGPIGRATLRTTAVLAGRLVVQAGTLLLLARVLGPAQFGELASFLALAVFLGALATFGTHLTLLREMVRDTSRRDALLPAALGTTALLGSVLLVIYLWACSHLPGSHGTLLIALAIGLAELVLQPFLVISSVERLAAGRIALSQLIKMMALPMQLAAAFFLWVVDVSSPLAIYAVAHFAAGMAALVLSLALLDRPWPELRRWRLLDRREWKDSGGFAVLAVTASGPAELDKVVAARLLPMELAGIYAAASRIAGASVIPVSSLMISASPRLFSESSDRIPARLLGMIFAGALAYGVGIAGVIWAAAPLAEVLFGASFSGTQDMLRWFALAVPALCLRLAGTNVLMTTGHPWMRAMAEGTGIGLMVAVAVTLLVAGIDFGMVIAVGSSEAVMALLSWIWICSRQTRAVSSPQ